MGVNMDKVQQAGTTTAPVTVIRPPRGWIPINLRELWAYRELLYFLTWRDIKVRYTQTAFGIVWAVIQPLFMMIIFSLFFGTLAKVPSENIPYPLFSYTGVLPWTLFAAGLTRSSDSLVVDVNLVQKVYFPRMLLPLAGILSPFVDFAIAFIILIGMMLYFGYYPGVTMFWILGFLVLELMLAAGLGLWLSAINVAYRDVRYAIPVLIQLGLYASPVVYSATFVPARFQTVYGLVNPMAGILEGFRWAVLGTKPPSDLLIASVAIILVILVSGAFYFRRREKAFADVA
jgi:lipopolysaccharide transport system permease protein